MKPSDALAGVTSLLLDTASVIYVVENRARFFAPTNAILRQAMTMGIPIVVSSLTLAEVLSKPGAGAQEIRDYVEFCTETAGVEFREVLFDKDFAVSVGHLRRTTNLKLHDCIRLASAERLGCDAIHTNDRQFSRASRRVIQVEDIVV